MANVPIKILLVEDSPVALEILQRIIKSSPNFEVVGTAVNGTEALKLIPSLNPDVICTDLHMKGMDGLEFTKQVMAKHAKPILVISDAVQKDDIDNIFQLLQAGAVDIFPKPKGGDADEYEKIKQKLFTKLKILAGVSVFTKPLKPDHSDELKTVSTSTENTTVSATVVRTNVTSPIQAFTIGASTGGPQALSKILSKLPSNFPVPVICVLHISPGFLSGLVNWLGTECKLPVKIAATGESPQPGTIYFAPEKSHLELDASGKFTHSHSQPVEGHCPSINVTFKSVAKFYGRGAAGILLTGMGKDGAAGMQAIANAGGLTIVQDEKTAVVFGMPKEAIALGAAKHVLPIQDIAPFLLRHI